MRLFITLMFCSLALAFGLLAYATRDWFGIGAMVASIFVIVIWDAVDERRKARRKMRLP